jgi:hypothetical protein
MVLGLDADATAVVLKKTWCHGQAIGPLYGAVCLYLYASNNLSVGLLVAGIVLPIWSYVSYRAVFCNYNYRVVLLGGALAMLCHLWVFLIALPYVTETRFLFLTLAAALLFLETLAFLGVVVVLRPPPRDIRASEDYEQVFEPVESGITNRGFIV